MVKRDIFGLPINRRKKPIIGLDFGLGKKSRVGLGLGKQFGSKQKPFYLGNESSQTSGKTKYERVNPSSAQRSAVLIKQKNKCAGGCGKHFYGKDEIIPVFDHVKRVDKAGITKVSNLQALCPNCHQKKTQGENLKEIEKRRTKPKKKEENIGLFGGFGQPVKRGKNPFGF